MRAHPTEERLLDLALGDGSPEARRHLDRCAACAARVEEVRAAAALVPAAEIPEPPEAYWPGFRFELRRRVAEEGRPHAAWRGWLLPLAVAAVAVMVAVVVHEPSRSAEPQAGGLASTTASTAPERPLAAWTALPPADQDADLPVLEGLVASGATGWDEGRGLGAYLAGLSDEDSELLATTLSGDAGAQGHSREGAL